MIQLDITQEIARREAEDGMRRSLDHAERDVEGWGDLAYLFLERFCRVNETFISEDVSDASKKWGMVQPPTDRAWGSVYRRALKAGIIHQDGAGRSRRRHHSICPLWRSSIYGGVAA